jgi:hypothetical protein
VTGAQMISRRTLATHLISWIVIGAVVGWLVVYLILRFGGDNPGDAALPSVIIGGLLGIAAGVGAVVLARRAEAAGRPIGRKRVRRADGARLSATDREIVRCVVPLLFGAAAVIAVVAVIIGIQWLGIHGARSKSQLLMVIWDLVVVAWMVDEARRLSDYVFEGLDALYFGCLLTLVLAGIGISRGVLSGGQVIIIVAAGIAAAAIGLVTWRVAGGRFVPLAASAAIIVAALALIAPLAL